MILDITLITLTPGTSNANGYDAEVEHQLSVVAERVSVVRTEFYEAYKAGLKPTIVFRIHPLDYAAAQITDGGTVYDASQVLDNGTRYNIIRTYERSEDIIELTCEKVV